MINCYYKVGEAIAEHNSECICSPACRQLRIYNHMKDKYEMKINETELAAAIDDMSSLCDRGKKDVRQLFERAFGIKLTEHKILKLGQRYKRKSGIYKSERYLVAETGNDTYALISLSDGRRWSEPSSSMSDIFGLKTREDFILVKDVK